MRGPEVQGACRSGGMGFRGVPGTSSGAPPSSVGGHTSMSVPAQPRGDEVPFYGTQSLYGVPVSVTACHGGATLRIA